jgi:hypothetical protein
MAWQRMRVLLKGEDPVDVQTNAWDWADVELTPGEGVKGLRLTFQVAHHALVRTGVDGVPRDFDGFMEVLDGIPETLDDDSPDLLDPTQPDR